jgi:hypothetical protein
MRAVLVPGALRAGAERRAHNEPRFAVALASFGGFAGGFIVPALLLSVVGYESRARATPSSSLDEILLLLYFVGVYALQRRRLCGCHRDFAQLAGACSPASGGNQRANRHPRSIGRALRRGAGAAHAHIAAQRRAGAGCHAGRCAARHRAWLSRRPTKAPAVPPPES